MTTDYVPVNALAFISRRHSGRLATYRIHCFLLEVSHLFHQSSSLWGAVMSCSIRGETSVAAERLSDLGRGGQVTHYYQGYPPSQNTRSVISRG